MAFVSNHRFAALAGRRTSFIRSFSFLFLFLAVPFLAVPQSKAPVGTIQQRAANPSNAAPAIDELQGRLRAAAVVRDAGDAGEVARANFLVLALASRKLGNVRVAESAFPHDAELNQRSLAWEDAAETPVGLEIAALYANRPDDSLIEASKALLLDPSSARSPADRLRPLPAPSRLSQGIAHCGCRSRISNLQGIDSKESRMDRVACP